ncbi:hypothetical protein GQ53DRAFT_244696 [Thozetella sp. PMI_491]|nr:hypothetical protein GQ53DRAFT_244696 [Thozetella sp. PMI_491]
MPSGHKSTKPKPAEVAHEAKRHYIPLIRHNYSHVWKTYSYFYEHPLVQLSFSEAEKPRVVSAPSFFVYEGDPVECALSWQARDGLRVPFICAANDKRPGGDWETGVVGYEERLCRRSTLSATLATPGPGSHVNAHYPITLHGGIYSDTVVVFRGQHDKYEKRNESEWQSLPVCSVPPMRWPKLTNGGAKYSFSGERELVKDKLRGALRICVYNDCHNIVIGDFGLGNSYRNPPQELAELWREVLLYDPDLRGRINCVAFVFEDAAQSTTQLILDDIAKKNKGGSSSGSSSKGKGKSSSGASSSSASSGSPTDLEIFSQVFNEQEIQRYAAQRDARYGLDNLLSG